MKEENLLDNSIKAIGYTSKGEIKEFYCNDGDLYCSNKDLVSLDIPEGVKEIYCWDNQLSELNLPKGVEYIDCSNNKIMELLIPKKVEIISCSNNSITELNIPNSVKVIQCDKIVKGLDSINWKCDIRIW